MGVLAANNLMCVRSSSVFQDSVVSGHGGSLAPVSSYIQNLFPAKVKDDVEKNVIMPEQSSGELFLNTITW